MRRRGRQMNKKEVIEALKLIKEIVTIIKNENKKDV